MAKTQAADGSKLAYCVVCKQKRPIEYPEKVTMKNGKPATRGTCGFCHTKLYRIGG